MSLLFFDMLSLGICPSILTDIPSLRPLSYKLSLYVNNFHVHCFIYINKICIVQPLLCKKGDEASPSIILAGQALLVKIVITLESHGIFGSNFVYFYIIMYILIVSSHWYEKKVMRLHRASFWPVKLFW